MAKLTKFKDFGDSLLPIEAEILSSMNKLEDHEKCSILFKLFKNTYLVDNKSVYDESIDKRKYSYIKEWVLKSLTKIDVDRNLEYLIDCQKKILTDKITFEEEKYLIYLFQNSDCTHFNFMKMYELARNYRHYLQIRLRYEDYETVANFLHKFEVNYEHSLFINEKIHMVTQDIILNYSKKKIEQVNWFEWLLSILYDEKLDGYNILLAWIRLVFIAHNRRQYEVLSKEFEFFENKIREGKFYSRRILTNFYSQYVLYYASIENFKQATYYGSLSIREKNNDYLFYINNLAAVLLRNKSTQEAYELLKSTNIHAKNTLNFHNKIGHTAYFIFTLIELNKNKQAENQAFVFFNAYKKQIFEYRWHLFFTAYFKSLLYNKKYALFKKIYTQYNMKEKDRLYKNSAHYSPVIPWMYHLSLYKLAEINHSVLKSILTDYANEIRINGYNIVLKELTEINKYVLKNEELSLT